VRDRILIPLIVIKVLVFIESGHIAQNLYPTHANIAYAAGLFIGILLQHFIPPKIGWKPTVLMAFVATAMSVAHALLLKPK
jgi:hypothetical protein